MLKVKDDARLIYRQAGCWSVNDLKLVIARGSFGVGPAPGQSTARKMQWGVLRTLCGVRLHDDVSRVRVGENMLALENFQQKGHVNLSLKPNGAVLRCAGSIPKELGALAKLTVLGLNRSKLTGGGGDC